jgi:methyl-accepting chemotaxis protein
MKGLTVMKKLRVSAKLLLGFGAAVAFTFAVGLVGMAELERLNRGYTEAIDVFAAKNAKIVTDFDVGVLKKSEADGIAAYKRGLAVTAAVLFLGVGFSVFLGLYVSGLISRPLRAAVKTLDRISNGELAADPPDKEDGDGLGAAVGRLARTLRELIVEDGGRVLQSAARKDLSLRLTGKYKGDFAGMKQNINAAMENLDDALAHVAATAGQMSNASAEIADESFIFIWGSEEPAASLHTAAQVLNDRAEELESLVSGFKLTNGADRYYADRSAAEVWVDVVPKENGGISILSAVSTTPAAISAYKRRQRRKKRIEARRAEKGYNQKRQIRDAVRAEKRKRRISSRSAKAKEIIIGAC